MKIGFFLVVKHDAQHFLHAASLIAEANRWMPGVDVVQLSDEWTPPVPDVTEIRRLQSGTRSLLEMRLRAYAALKNEWLLLDTDVSIRNNVVGVFDDKVFDVALVDRQWTHLPQGDEVLHTMPFNTGVVFSRTNEFWQDVLDRWLTLAPAARDWLSEQRMVWDVVRSGKYRVKILPGMAYNYPPSTADAIAPVAALVHYKGPRKPWLSAHATRVLGAA